MTTNICFYHQKKFITRHSQFPAPVINVVANTISQAMHDIFFLNILILKISNLCNDGNINELKSEHYTWEKDS